MMNLFRKKDTAPEVQQVRLADQVIADLKEPEFWEVYNLCKPFTMTSVERMYSLYKAVTYVLESGIKGDFVECGVWKGGSAMLIARMLAIKNITNRRLFLYDTYEGMSAPSNFDKDYQGHTASELLQTSDKEDAESVWCYSSFDEVRENMKKTHYPEENIILIKGMVEHTIPGNVPTPEIALLRLDTDWYESTLHELNHLYPLLQHNGVLIIDDYGHWEGCRKAVDEYFATNKVKMLLNRIDNTGRIGIKSFN
jgi:O-methyltransferase